MAILVALMSKPSKLVENKWKIVNPFPPYQKIYNEAQENLEMLSGLDELLSGKGTYIAIDIAILISII